LLNTILGSFSTGVAPSTNSYESIATVTVGAGGSSEVLFSSIPSTYTHLQVRCIARCTASTSDIDGYMQFNSDTGANYSWHFVYGDGSSTGTSNGTSSNYISVIRTTGASSSASRFGVGVIDILDYANTNKYKTSRSLSGQDQNGSGLLFLDSGNWRNTTAINAIRFYYPTGNFAEYSHFALYGIKGA
jgi:hypothetical protein